MANYDNIRGVGYQRYVEDETEPKVDVSDARIDEMYFTHGDLDISMDTPDGHIRVSVPVKAVKDWDEFVDSLPKWNHE